MSARIFLLSPANSAGVKAQALLRGTGSSALATAMRAGKAVPLGKVFASLSTLYFRGKLAYARRFGAPGCPLAQGYAITPNSGLVPMEAPITHAEFAEMSSVPIDLAEPRYTEPLTRSARELLAAAPSRAEFVLLGSIATGKYVEALLPIFGAQLLFPTDFIGRGDMSRGGLMLRSAAEGRELAYQPVQDAIRRGTRPAKLPPKPRAIPPV